MNRKNAMRQRAFGMMEIVLTFSVAAAMISGSAMYVDDASRKSSQVELKKSFQVVRNDLEIRYDKNMPLPDGDLVQAIFPSLPGFNSEDDGMTHKWSVGTVDISELNSGGNTAVRFIIQGVSHDRCIDIANALYDVNSFEGYESILVVNNTAMAGPEDDSIATLRDACGTNGFENDIGMLMGPKSTAVADAAGYTLEGSATYKLSTSDTAIIIAGGTVEDAAAAEAARLADGGEPRTIIRISAPVGPVDPDAPVRERVRRR